MTDPIPPTPDSKSSSSDSVDSAYRKHSEKVGLQSDSSTRVSAKNTDADHSLQATASFFDKVISLCENYSRESVHRKQDLRSYLVQVGKDDQATLLRNLLEYEVRNRRKVGESPAAKEYIDLLPEHEALIRRIFLDASSVSIAAGWDAKVEKETRGFAPVASRLGEYRLIREIGRGGMGAVFEAMHLTRGHRVALKTLPTVSGDSLHRFKREFRALADVTHPNLVGLRTLENDGGQWFITLDLLEGCDFLTYVRPTNQLDLARLRASIGQLAAGLMALHARGIVHRDLKPGNVMVTGQGRVVILDFGLVAELDRAGLLTASGMIAGTPAYMAPEQAAGEQVGPPADWYAFGVMLYEALSGKRPFSGEARRIVADKQQLEAPPLLDPSIPLDLADLANRLLARNANNRPDPLQIAGVVASAVPMPTSHAATSEQLVGRETQFAALADALNAFRRDTKPITVFIKGRSGEGKTSLAESFLSPLRKDASFVVMSGRCYDRESVPFKALDTIIDALTTHLKSLRPSDAALILPDDIGLLAELFPVLRRCEVVAQKPRGRIDALDQQQVRQRAFSALRLLLDRIGQQTPIVWFIDDLQWGDADSAGAMFEILRPPAEPHVLFLGSFRSDEADTSPFLLEWNARQQQNDVTFSDRSVNVGPLSLDEATQLVVNVVGRNDEVVRRRAVQFHAQAGGNPFLLVELAGCFDPDADAFHTTDIHGVLARKLEQLPPEAKPLLDAISVSGQSVELSEAAEAAGLTASPDETLTRMRNVRLLRVVGNKVDTYHDRIRYAVLDRMEDGPLRAMHEQLALVIERHGGGLTDQDIHAFTRGQDDLIGREANARVYDLSFHCDAAGNKQRALTYSLLAARQARSQFSLDVAAQQYAIAKRNAEFASPEIRFQIARGNGETLMHLLRHNEATVELESASALAEKTIDIAEVQGLKGELAFRIGKIAESIDHYENSLRTLGMHVPRSRFGQCLGVISETVVQFFHCLFPFRLYRGSANENSDLTNHLLGRMEWALYAHNVLKLLWASMAGLNRAERIPRSKSLVINYVVHANDMAVLGWHNRAEKYYRMAISLSEELNDQWGAALGLAHFAFGCVGAGRYEQSLEMATPSRISFTKLGDLFELHLTYTNLAKAEYGLGNLAVAFQHSKWLFDSCVRHQDNCLGAWAAYFLTRCCRGQLPVDELIGCVQVLPGNSLAKSPALMAEAFWHSENGRSIEALVAIEKAWKVCLDNLYIVSLNSNVLCQLVTTLRLHAESLDAQGSKEATKVWRRFVKMAKWANRLSWFLPPERAHALRELSLAYAHQGRIKKAWNLAALSCKKAEALKAKYEYAKSLLVLGQLAKKLGRPEADDQIHQAQTEIVRIEKSIDDLC